MTPPLKPGVTTTEFWTVILCGLLLTAQAALSMTTVAWAAGGVTLLGLIYTMQRGKLKSQASITALEMQRRERDKVE
jgi:O-antigen/teichoic acid export membrane protein